MERDVRKRSRPTSETRNADEVGLGIGSRRSEAYSDITSDSGELHIQRIHSDVVPTLPDAPDAGGFLVATDDSVAEGPANSLQYYSWPVKKKQSSRAEASQGPIGAATVTSSAGPWVYSILQTGHGKCDSSRQLGAASTVNITPEAQARCPLQDLNSIRALSLGGLQQHMDALSSTEQSLLTEFRNLRKEYDARVAAISQLAFSPQSELQSAAARIRQALDITCPSSRTAVLQSAAQPLTRKRSIGADWAPSDLPTAPSTTAAASLTASPARRTSQARITSRGLYTTQLLSSSQTPACQPLASEQPVIAEAFRQVPRMAGATSTKTTSTATLPAVVAARSSPVATGGGGSGVSGGSKQMEVEAEAVNEVAAATPSRHLLSSVLLSYLLRLQQQQMQMHSEQAHWRT